MSINSEIHVSFFAGDDNDGEVEFTLLEDILIREADKPIMAMVIDRTYPSLLDHVGDGSYFQDRAILAPTN